MKNRNLKPAWLKKSLYLCLTAALLAGCSSDDGKDGTNGLNGADGAAGAAGADGNGNQDPSLVTTSGYAFPSDAIFVAPNAQDGDNITADLLLALFDAPAGSTVVMPKGSFVVDETITVANANELTLTGYGITDTKLDFTGATGDDAFRFEAGLDITIRDFGVYEANKNGIKVVGVNGVHLTYTATIWEGALEADNGAYGLYPLQSQNILMEHNYARGSADAGIYVGQSNNIVVRNNIAKENVAGIEIENSNNADVYNNLAVGNTGGILVFDLPGLDQAYGGNVRVFNNESYANNAENFAGGGAVSIVPPGTGILIFATSGVEIYNNTLTDNETSAIEIASYFLSDADVANYPANYGGTMANGWSPQIKNVYMHDNIIKRSGANPRGTLLTDIVNGYTAPVALGGKGETMPAILYGGIGELLSNAGALAAFNGLITDQDAIDDGVNYNPYTAADLICANNNINDNEAAALPQFPDVNIGLVYGTDPTDNAPANFDGDGNPVPTLRSEPLQGNATLLNCTLDRLTPTEVTFRGKTYGCSGDDLAEPACSL